MHNRPSNHPTLLTRSLSRPEVISAQYDLANNKGFKTARRVPVNNVANPKPLKSHERIVDPKRRQQGIVILAADRYRFGV